MPNFNTALSRKPGDDFFNGLTTANLGAPDLELAKKQHGRYVSTLGRLGVDVELLEPLEGFPDAVFVEDTAIVTEIVAVITRPGADTRVGETDTIAQAIAKYRNVEYITLPGATIDGGDVLRMGHTFFVGMSNRTNEAGMDNFESLISKYGSFAVVPVPVPEGLHLKSFVTEAAEDTLLITKSLADHPAFKYFDKIIVPEDEEYAANALLINGTLIMAANFEKTIKLCEDKGCKVIPLDMSEFRKMDGALTCLSLRF